MTGMPNSARVKSTAIARARPIARSRSRTQRRSPRKSSSAKVGDILQHRPARPSRASASSRASAMSASGPSSILLGRQVVADAGDVGQAGLRRLGQGARQRDDAIGMAARAVMTAQPVRIARREVADIAQEGGDADIARHVPDAHGDVGRLVFVEQIPATGVVDRGEVDNAGGAALDRLGDPQRHRVALDHLVECCVDRLNRMISGGQPVRSREEKPVGRRQRIVRVYDARPAPSRVRAAEDRGL